MNPTYTATFKDGQTVTSHKSSRVIHVAMRASYRRIDGGEPHPSVPEVIGPFISWHSNLKATDIEIRKVENRNGRNSKYRFQLIVADFAPATAQETK